MKMTWKQLEQKSIPRRRERGRGGAGREAIMIVKGRGDGTIGGGSRGERRRKTSEWRKKGDAVGWSWRDFRRGSPRVRVRRDGAGGSLSEQEGRCR